MNNPYSAPDAQLSMPASGETYQPKVFSFSGRIGRLRYLAYSMIPAGLILIPGFIAGMMLAASGDKVGMVSIVILCLLCIPALIYAYIPAKRRLNDLGRSGWWLLLFVVPIVNLIFALYLMFGAGSATANKYGLPPSKNSRAMWIVALVPVLIFILGILAAVAIPAYQNYVERAKAAAVSRDSL